MLEALMENSGLVVVDKKDVGNENVFIDNNFDLFGGVQIGSKIKAQRWTRGKNFQKTRKPNHRFDVDINFYYRFYHRCITVLDGNSVAHGFYIKQNF